MAFKLGSVVFGALLVFTLAKAVNAHFAAILASFAAR